MKIKRTFDRDINLIKEVAPGINLPWGFGLIRFKARSDQLEPLVLMHVVADGESPAHGNTEALCGKRGLVGQDVALLSKGKSYPFCLKCQRAAKAIEEGGA